ncbi:13636_t:CDS:10, partial [Acaulospora morrowiae]
IIDQATKKFYTNDYHQFQNAEEKRKQMINSGTSFVKGSGPNHSKSVYHARLLNTIMEIANNIKSLRDSSNLTKPSAASEEILKPLEIQVEPPRPKNKICRLCSFANLFPKSDNRDINNFLIRTSNNQAKGILEWIPYEDFSYIECIGCGAFSRVYKAMWHRGHIKHWNLKTGEVVRSEPVEVALKVLADSDCLRSTFLDKLRSFHLFKSNELKYRHIVKCYGVSQDPETKNYIFVMQYANYGNLRNLLATEFHGRLNWNLKKKVVLSLLESIKEIHQQNLIHRDLHKSLDPEELLVAEKKREEMVKSGIPFVEKLESKHTKSVYSSKTLDYLSETSEEDILYDLIDSKEIPEHNSSNVLENFLWESETVNNDNGEHNNNDANSTISDHNSDEMDIDPQIQTLRELVLKSKTKTRTLSIILDIDEPTTSRHHTNETPLEAQKRPRKHKLHKEKSDDIMESRVLSEFKKLESAILNFNNKLNSVTDQVHDTRHKVETDKTWPVHKFEKNHDQHEYDSLRIIGKELDLTLKYRDLDEVVIHIDRYGWDIAFALSDTQDEWMKGKNGLIEKAKTLVDAKKNKWIKTYEFNKLLIYPYAKTQVDATSAKVIDILPITALQIQTEIPNIVKIIVPTTDQEAMTPIRINIAEPKTMQSAIDYTRALQHLPIWNFLVPEKSTTSYKTTRSTPIPPDRYSDAITKWRDKKTLRN